MDITGSYTTSQVESQGNITIRPYRAIAGIIATVTQTEQHSDELIITEHPVEQGAAISDHAYKAPQIVVLRLGWSLGDAAAQGNPQYLQDVYAQILKLQEDRTPFDIYTGKRVYKNMLLKSIATETSIRTENSLQLTLACRQIIIVSPVVITVSSDGTIQKNPEATVPVTSTGTKQLKTTTLYQGG